MGEKLKFREVVKTIGKGATYGSLCGMFGAATAYIVPVAAIANPIAGIVIGAACAVAGTLTAGAVMDSCTGPYVDKVVDTACDAGDEFQAKYKTAKDDIKTAEEYTEIVDSKGKPEGRKFLKGKGYSDEDIEKIEKEYDKDLEKRNKRKAKRGSRG